MFKIKKHDITGKVGRAGVVAGNTVVDFNKKHDITGKVGRGANSGWNKIVALERKNQITSKIGNVFKVGWKKTKEVNEKYKVTDTIGNGVVTGFNTITDAASGIIEKSDAKLAADSLSKAESTSFEVDNINSHSNSIPTLPLPSASSSLDPWNKEEEGDFII